ncbi:MAG: DUF1844 domain-containing protein [Deltaproteobacteria bacterium]|nr:DUF1844 domain-containing protein [Deltaproteobacteria bacterium]
MTKESRTAKQERGGNQTTSDAPPKINFSTFVYSLFTTARFQLGEIPNPYTQKYEEDLTLAGETIDILTMLEKKTAGNLTKEEEKLIEDLLYNLRMTYLGKIKKQEVRE